MKQTRFSKQRQVIYDALKATKSHPTAEDIYISIKKENPTISLGTVYRNLNFFLENNLAIKIDVGDHLVHYDAEINPHYHLYCRECLRVFDLDIPFETSFIQSLSEQTKFKIDSYSTIFYGQCHICAKK